MKKSTIIVLSVCLVLVGLVLLFKPNSIATQPNPSDLDTVPDSNNPSSISNSTEDFKIIDKVSISADLAVGYNDLPSLVADSEVIVSGTVKEVNPVIDAQGVIFSVVTLAPEGFFKGNSSEAIEVYVDGGIISAKEFYEFHREYLSAKTSAETFESRYASLKSNEMVESVFMGIENIKPDDQLLMFLTFDEGINYYRVTGTAYGGKFSFDESSKEFLRSVENEATLNVSLTELTEIAKSTPDNSENLKIQARNVVPAFKDPTIIPRDPYYDQFKE